MTQEATMQRRGPARSLAFRIPIATIIVLVLGLTSSDVFAQDSHGGVPIGMVSYLWGPTEDMLALNETLEELGYLQNRDYILGVRSAEGSASVLEDIITQFSRDGAKVLYVSGLRELRAVQSVGTKLPVVYSTRYSPFDQEDRRGDVLISKNGEPLRSTGVVNLFRPGDPRSLDIFHQLLPHAKRILLPYDATDRRISDRLPGLRAASSRLGVSLIERPLHTLEESRRFFSAIRVEDVSGLLPLGTRLNISGYALLTSVKNGIPALFPRAWMAEYGGLASYGPSWNSLGRHAAGLMAQIIQGKMARDIPVKYVNQAELVINLRVAEQLGLRIDPKVLKKAAHVIR